MTKTEFIEQIAKYVQKYAPKYDIKVCSPIIAQACLESAYGTSKKAQYNNFFGLKYRDNRVPCSSGYFVDGGSEQGADGKYTAISTKWFKFDTMEAGVEGYFQFINIGNYANLKGVTDPKTYLTNIKNDGYATSLNYVTNVMNVITTNNLTRFDIIKSEEKGGSVMYRVAIDAGHGSNTAGKRHPDGYREHYSNTYMAYYLDQILNKNGISTFRCSWDDDNAKDDTDVALGTRQNVIKAAKCNISISIHANASGDGNSYNSGEGIETFYHNDPSKAKDSARLAKLIQAEVIKGTSQKNRGVKCANFAMCNALAMNVQAAALVETAFMTNKRESDLLKSDEFCRECAREIAQGIFNYFGVTGNVNVPLSPVGSGATSNTPSSPAATPTNSTTTSTPAATATNNSNLVAGNAYKLNNVNFYASAKGTVGSKKTGTFYLWSAEVVSGRVRMTNVKSRVGVAGQVTGWVNVSDLGVVTSSSASATATSTSAATPAKPATTTSAPAVTQKVEIKAGAKVELKDVTLYSSSVAKTGSKRTGTYYLWDAKVLNGRIKITNAKNRVGVSGQITGWINVSDIQ